MKCLKAGQPQSPTTDSTYTLTGAIDGQFAISYIKAHPAAYSSIIALDSYLQVSDLQGWKNSAAIEYSVRGIPVNFLLDRDGTIIARGLRGEALEKKLSELLH